MTGQVRDLGACDRLSSSKDNRRETGYKTVEDVAEPVT
jgi:hypothetical protein